MKKLLFILLAALFIIPLSLRAQEKNNQIKTSLVFILAEEFKLSYERLLNDEMGLQLELTLGDLSSIRPSFRYYMSESKIAPNGVFIGPSLHFVDDDFGFCLMIGYQRLFKSKISLEAFGGPGLYGSGTQVWGGINLGFAF